MTTADNKTARFAEARDHRDRLIETWATDARNCPREGCTFGGYWVKEDELLLAVDMMRSAPATNAEADDDLREQLADAQTLHASASAEADDLRERLAKMTVEEGARRERDIASAGYWPRLIDEIQRESTTEIQRLRDALEAALARTEPAPVPASSRLRDAALGAREWLAVGMQSPSRYAPQVRQRVEVMIDELSAALEEDLVVDANKKGDWPITIEGQGAHVQELRNREDVIEYGQSMWRIIADYQVLHALDATKRRELMANGKYGLVALADWVRIHGDGTEEEILEQIDRLLAVMPTVQPGLTAAEPTITLASHNAQVQSLRTEIGAGEALRTAAWEALESYVPQA